MKFCPNCGMPLNDKVKCECGYDVESNTVDETIYATYIDDQKRLYESQIDNMSMIGMSRMMGVDKSVTDEEIIAMHNRVIFNKDPDNILDSSELLKELNKDN